MRTRMLTCRFFSDCLLPTETGVCRGRFKMFGFNQEQQACVEFIYGGTSVRDVLFLSFRFKESLAPILKLIASNFLGCGGNKNRFHSRDECLQQCGNLIVSDNTNMMRLQQLNAQSPTLIFQQERRRSAWTNHVWESTERTPGTNHFSVRCNFGASVLLCYLSGYLMPLWSI